jgi:hypothetical protein
MTSGLFTWMGGRFQAFSPSPNVYGEIGAETPLVHPGVVEHLFSYSGYLWLVMLPVL